MSVREYSIQMSLNGKYLNGPHRHGINPLLLQVQSDEQRYNQI